MAENTRYLYPHTYKAITGTIIRFTWSKTTKFDALNSVGDGYLENNRLE